MKGNAYGLGVAPISKALWDAGCRHFFVARPVEGEDLRALLPDATIYVLDGLFPGQAEYYAIHRLCPALISLDEIREWAAFGRRFGRALPCAIHVDTGINRLGLTLAEFDTLLADEFLRAGLDITLLMSHLACADDPAHPLNKVQAERFATLRKKLPGVPASLSNSSGIFLGKGFTNDLCRPGIALYGGNPTPGKKNPMTAVATLEGTVLQVREVKKGETVGYSATWKARVMPASPSSVQATRMACRVTSPPAEGWPRAGACGGQALPHRGPHLHGHDGGGCDRPARRKDFPRHPRRNPRPAPPHRRGGRLGRDHFL